MSTPAAPRTAPPADAGVAGPASGVPRLVIASSVTGTLVLALGRYPALIVPLAVAASLARKRATPEGPGSLHIETPTFALTVIAVIVILTLLQFMPALVLGPVAEHLSLVHGGTTP